MENEFQQQQQEQQHQERYQRREKRTAILLLLLILLVTVTIGYATLSASLNISGSSTIQNNTWNVTIDDGTDAIECPPGDVCTINPANPDSLTPDDGVVTPTNPNPNGAIIWMDGNTVYFKHVLAQPGDVFTFTTTFKNKGSIDAKLASVTQSSLNATAQNFMTYVVTYADGTTPASGDILNANAEATFKVTVAYKSTITALPTAEELALINETSQGHTGATSLFTVTYEQK